MESDLLSVHVLRLLHAYDIEQTTPDPRQYEDTTPNIGCMHNHTNIVIYRCFVKISFESLQDFSTSFQSACKRLYVFGYKCNNLFGKYNYKSIEKIKKDQHLSSVGLFVIGKKLITPH